MHALIIIAVSAAGFVAGAAAVRAADLEVGAGCCFVEYGPEQLVILDNEPGVVIRRWWLPPWRNRHYYPHGRWASKKVEKSESAPRKRVARTRPRPAPGYERYWANPPAYEGDPGALISADTPLPRENPYRYMPSVVVAPTVR